MQKQCLNVLKNRRPLLFGKLVRLIFFQIGIAFARDQMDDDIADKRPCDQDDQIRIEIFCKIEQPDLQEVQTDIADIIDIGDNVCVLICRYDGALISEQIAADRVGEI